MDSIIFTFGGIENYPADQNKIILEIFGLVVNGICAK